MKKILIAGTVALLGATTLYAALGHDNLLPALISIDPLSQLIRVAVIGLLVGLLLTSPPRSIHFRTALGIASALLSFGVAVLLSQYAMAPFDALIFTEVAILFALESLEAPVLSQVVEKSSVKTYVPKNKKLAI